MHMRSRSRLFSSSAPLAAAVPQGSVSQQAIDNLLLSPLAASTIANFLPSPLSASMATAASMAGTKAELMAVLTESKMVD